jgi:CBS domain-containing protein
VNVTCKPMYALTVGDVMSRDPVVIPRQMMVREAACLLHRTRASKAPVVDEQGRFVGTVTPADVFRWIDAGCPETAVDPERTCPYQVRGRLLTGKEAVICILAHGECPFQARQPTDGGRHTDLCTRLGTQRLPYGATPRYVTTGGLTVRPQTPLLQLIRQIVDARDDGLVVLDEFGRPVGIVSVRDVLNAAADSITTGRPGNLANREH